MDDEPWGGPREGSGRKTVESGKKHTKRVAVYLTPSQRIALDLAAKMEDKTPSQLARDLIVDNLPETF